MSRFSTDLGSNSLDDAGDFESHVAPRGDIYGYGEEVPEREDKKPLTAYQLIEILEGFEPETEVSVAYAHNGVCVVSAITGVCENGETVQLNEEEFQMDCDREA